MSRTALAYKRSIFKLVVSRASQARGYAKRTSKPYFLPGHNIESLGPKREVRDHVEQLLEGARFIYKNKEDNGAIHPEFSENDMLPAATIAFVYTLIENDLDEWVTREHIDVPFTAAAYLEDHVPRPPLTYQRKYFETKTHEADIMPRLLRHMLKVAGKHAKVSEARAAPVVHVSNADIEAAKQEWDGWGFTLRMQGFGVLARDETAQWTGDDSKALMKTFRIYVRAFDGIAASAATITHSVHCVLDNCT